LRNKFLEVPSIIRATQSGHLHNERLTMQEFSQILERRIEMLDVAAAANDVSRFVRDVGSLNIWSQEYFKDLALRISITEA